MQVHFDCSIHQYSGPSLSGHSPKATLSNKAIDLFLLPVSSKATSLMWPQLLDKWGNLIREELLHKVYKHRYACAIRGNNQSQEPSAVQNIEISQSLQSFNQVQLACFTIV